MGYIYWFILGLYKTPPKKNTPTRAQPWQGSTPAVSLHGGTSPHHRSDGRAWKPGTRCTIRMVTGPLGFDAFRAPKHAWIMLDQVGFTNTIHNFRQLWWDVTCLSWCRLLYIHHHSPYFLNREVDQQAFMFFIDQEYNGGLHQKIVWLLVSIFPSTTVCPCLVFWERPTIQQAVQQVASCRASGRRRQVDGWKMIFQELAMFVFPCLALFVWKGWSWLIWDRLSMSDVLNNTSGDHVRCFIHSWFHSSWTRHWRWFPLPPIGSLDPEVTPKSRQLKELKHSKSTHLTSIFGSIFFHP